MWGESNITRISTDANTNNFGTISFLRSVARIQLTTDASLDSQFEILELKVHNARETGLAAPLLDSIRIEEGEKIVAIGPSLTTSSTIDADEMLYKNFDGNDLQSSIYVNEAQNKGVNKEDAFFLIIKAYYTAPDESPNTTKATYYKIGFHDLDGNPVDILRNVTYNLTITAVSSPGEDNEEDAVGAESSNLTVALTDWPDGEMKYVVFSGKYYLAVSECELILPRPSAEHSFLVKTNYPSGWEAEIATGNEWITELTPPSPIIVEESGPLSFKVGENTVAEREGKIAITAGNLTLDVNVIQTTNVEYTLIIEIDDQDENTAGSYVDFNKTITFTSGYHARYDTIQIAPRTLRVTWTPADTTLFVDYNRYFEWRSDTDIKTFYEAAPGAEKGEAIIKVVPTRLEERNDFFPEIVGDIQFQVGNEENTRQNILIRRKHHEVYIEK